MIVTNDTIIGYYQERLPKKLRLVVTTTSGLNTIIETESVIQDSFEINRYVFPSDKPCFGTAIASEFKVTLLRSSTINAIDFDGASVDVRLGLLADVSTSFYSYMYSGTFIIDEITITDDTITIEGLDILVKLDKVADPDLFEFPMTIQTFLVKISRVCGLNLITGISSMPNYNLELTSFPEGYENLTYRQLVMWCCDIMGCCAYGTMQGYLGLTWINDYRNLTSAKITSNKRYSSTFGDPLTITGIKAKVGDSSFSIGTSAYCIEISDNPFITESNATTILSNLTGRLGTTYVPCRISAISMQYLEPMDYIVATNKNNSDCYILVTDVTYYLNTGTEVASKGTTTGKTTYSYNSAFSTKQSYELNQRTAEITEQTAEKLDDMANFSELISNALGLYCTKETQTDGSTKYYMHDQSVLANSSNIFTMTSNGIAWTNEGMSGTWQYGVSTAGDGFFRYISAQGINVQKSGQDYHVEITPSAFSIYYQNILVTQIVSNTMQIPKVNVSEFAQMGNIAFVPHYTNNVIDGTDIVFMA